MRLTTGSSPSLRDGEGTRVKRGGGVRESASGSTDVTDRHRNPHTPSPPFRWVPSPRKAWGGIARLPFLLLGACGLWLIGQGAIIPAKAWAAQILLERAFAESVVSGRPVKAWPWADAAPVARLRVPRLDRDAIILSGGSGEAMAFGPTLLPGGGVLGERGTAVFAAHRDTHFRFIGALRAGDVIEVDEVNGRTTRYRVGSGRVVRYDRFGVDRNARRPSIALVTCWPIGGTGRGPLRYVVQAELAA